MHSVNLILAIETSNPSAIAEGAGAVAIGRLNGDGSEIDILAERSVPAGRRHDDALAPTIASLIEDVGAAPRNLRRLAVSIGPGGFTGIRVGVTTAKMIAIATGAQVIGVPTARVAGVETRCAGACAVALASKGETAWVDISGPSRREMGRPEGMDPREQLQPGSILNAAHLAAAHERWSFQSLIADEHLPAPMRDWAERAGVAIESPRLSGSACIRASAGLSPVNAAALAPLYPREPEAVTKWRALHGAGG